MNQREQLGFNAKITPVKPLNKEMTLCKCYVLALGKNRNYSHISKETADNAVPTMYNIPVVGHMYVDENGEYFMGGHDVTIVRDEETGKFKFKSLCVPFGTVPNPNNIRYENLIDSDGNEVVYQVADIILWTGRYPELQKAIYDDSIYFGQSMEIDVEESETLLDDSRYTDIKKFSYSALCLLGKSDNPDKHVEPCFPESRVEPYQFSMDDHKFTELMNEFKEELKECFQAINNEKGGKTRLTIEVCNSVLAEFGLSKEELNFEITEEMTEEELRDNLAKFTEASSEPTSVDTEVVEVKDETNSDDESEKEPAKEDAEADEPKEDVSEEPKKDDETSDEPVQDDQSESDSSNFSKIDKQLTYGQKLDILAEAVRNLDIYDGVNYASHCLIDCNDTYVFVTRHSEINGESKHSILRAKYVIEDSKAMLTSDFEEMVMQLLTISEAEEVARKRAEYDELKKFQQERLEADRINEYDAVISEFSDLTKNEEFAQLVANKMSFENADALREKCFAIRGKAMVFNMVPEKPTMKLPLDKKQESHEVYGGLFSQYPPKR